MEEFWKFVAANASASASALRLKYHGRTLAGIDLPLAITQIECREKYAKKFADTLAADPHFLFPCTLAAEQATSDLLARYHASLIAEGCAVVDLTAGMGIDALHLSAKAASVVAVEMDCEREKALAYNCRNAANVTAVCADCRDYLQDCSDFDVAFIDPARRDSAGKRVFALADCEPDVTQMLPLLRSKCHTLIVKASPMLDLTQMAKELPGTTTLICLGTTTECKEVVAVVDLRDNDTQAITIKAVTLSADAESEFAFTAQQEAEAVSEYAAAEVGQYLYEPYPAVMKAGAFSLLAARYGLKKLHANTHLYVSDSLAADFPGTIMKIQDVYTYESKHLKRIKNTYPVLSVTTRNFDVGADALRKKLGVKDGLPLRLFAANTVRGKQMIVAR